jgi:hypothetical protein
LRKDAGPDETAEGAMERLITSTPSSTAYRQVIQAVQHTVSDVVALISAIPRIYYLRTWSTAAITSDIYPPKG